MKKKKNMTAQYLSLKATGHKAGTKRSDKRWVDEHGKTWASRFECLVYAAARRAKIKVRKCDKGGPDTFSYHSKVRDGVCQSCQGTDIIKQRRYTPDLHVLLDSGEEARGQGGYYVETKGYLRAAQRKLVRDFCKAGKIADLRFILQTDYKCTKLLTIGGWIDKFLHCKWAVFDGEYPAKWSQNEARVTKKAIRKVS